MNNLLGGSLQDSFPIYDLQPNAVDRLSLMLQNRELHGRAHQSAEAATPLYKIAHSLALSSLNSGMRLNSEQLAAVGLGMSTYESTVALVNPIKPVAELTAMHESVLAFANGITEESTLNGMDDIIRALAIEARNLTQVITDVSERFAPGKTGFALWGAAVLRQLDVKVAAL